MGRIWTILELITETTGYFKKKGIESARLDAELLLAHCLGMERIQLYLTFERALTESELAAYREVVKHRAAGEPVAYLIGYREFWSLKIRVRNGVLIPRPETELLVEEGIKMLSTSRRKTAVLDIGTGSGALAIALAREITGSRIYAVDISPAALDVARQNISEHGLQERIQLICGRGLSPFKQGAAFDLIISNPPYIRSREIETLASEIKNHEPREALDGGEDGLEFYRRWIPQMPSLLSRDGRAVLETGSDQAAAVSQFFRDAGFSDIAAVKDYAGHYRAVIACIK